MDSAPAPRIGAGPHSSLRLEVDGDLVPGRDVSAAAPGRSAQHHEASGQVSAGCCVQAWRVLAQPAAQPGLGYVLGRYAQQPVVGASGLEARACKHKPFQAGSCGLFLCEARCVCSPLLFFARLYADTSAPPHLPWSCLLPRYSGCSPVWQAANGRNQPLRRPAALPCASHPREHVWWPAVAEPKQQQG